MAFSSLDKEGRPHAPQNSGVLGELDGLVTDDFHPVSPRVEKIEKSTGQRFDARLRQGMTDSVLVIDHQPEMTVLVSGMGATLLQSQELIAQIDESRGLAPASKLED